MSFNSRLFILFILTSLHVSAQQKDALDSTKVFTKVEKEADFPGGAKSWFNYLVNNLDSETPINNGAPAGQYTVLVQFQICTDGSLCDIVAKNNPGYGLSEEAIRVIKKSGNWVPAEVMGNKVKSYHIQPITFVVEDSRRRKKHSNR